MADWLNKDARKRTQDAQTQALLDQAAAEQRWRKSQLELFKRYEAPVAKVLSDIADTFIELSTWQKLTMGKPYKIVPIFRHGDTLPYGWRLVCERQEGKKYHYVLGDPTIAEVKVEVNRNNLEHLYRLEIVGFGGRSPFWIQGQYDDYASPIDLKLSGDVQQDIQSMKNYFGKVIAEQGWIRIISQYRSYRTRQVNYRLKCWVLQMGSPLKPTEEILGSHSASSFGEFDTSP